MTFNGTAKDTVGRRRFIVVVGLMAVFFVVVGGFIINYLDYRHDNARESCERTVMARQGQRTMWEYLVDQRDPADPEVIAFVAELDKRLPPYECVDNVPTPVTPPDPD
jgi:hypothetical protein